ncbi:synapsin-1-like [Rhinopithecus roxellana]|uniref:synapsin-1-like n=1 Tax=Rhinopithecus roxellana TaxID=61622 RepID=UPI0012378CD3|nr:synapsin-1-like [Rhinopithecus roxellana]
MNISLPCGEHPNIWTNCFGNDIQEVPICCLPPLPKNGPRGKEKKHTPGAAAGELVNKSTLDASPCPPGSSGSWGRSRREGEARVGWVGGVGWRGCRCSQRWGRSAERFPPAPPGLTHALMARASSRPSQAGGRRGEEGTDAVPAPGSGTRGGDPPITRRPRRAEKAAPTRRPRPSRLPGVSYCLLQPARRAPAPTPEGRYLGAPAPRSLPAAVGASLRITHPTSASAEGEGKGRGSAGTGPSCGGRHQPEWSPCAPQRSAAAGGCGRPCRPDTYRCLGAPTASLPRFSPPADAGRGDPSQGDQGEGLSSTPISWGIPRSDPPPRVTPPLLSGRCSTWP